MRYGIELLYKNDFHNRLKVLENKIAVLGKTKIKNIQALKTRIYPHYYDFDILDKKFQHFLDNDKQELYRITMTLNNHHLAIKMLTKSFTACMKVLWKYLEFYDT